MPLVELPLFVYLFGSLIWWGIAVTFLKNARREMWAASHHLDSKFERTRKWAKDLLPKATARADKWRRPAYFSGANLAVAAIPFSLTVLLQPDGRADLDNFELTVVYLWHLAALLVSGLILKRYRADFDSPIRDLPRSHRLFLVASIGLALMAFMVWANRPIR